jgi:3-vinyl bacteriochlorophyllide hydratase
MRLVSRRVETYACSKRFANREIRECQNVWTSKGFDTFVLLLQSRLQGWRGHNQIMEASGNTLPLYTAEERIRRDSTIWTLIQGILAPVQFLIFAVSLVLVLRTLSSGEGQWIADASVVVKTVALYTIMVTGAIWEKVVFGRYLFAPAFWWEDFFSMFVIALHTLYLIMLFGGFGSPEARLFVALAAYATYAINATQFLLKLRAARLQAIAA